MNSGPTGRVNGNPVGPWRIAPSPGSEAAPDVLDHPDVEVWIGPDGHTLVACSYARAALDLRARLTFAPA